MNDHLLNLIRLCFALALLFGIVWAGLEIKYNRLRAGLQWPSVNPRIIDWLPVVRLCWRYQDSARVNFTILEFTLEVRWLILGTAGWATLTRHRPWFQSDGLAEPKADLARVCKADERRARRVAKRAIQSLESKGVL